MKIQKIINYLYERPLLTMALSLGVPPIVGAVIGHYTLEDTIHRISLSKFDIDWAYLNVSREVYGAYWGTIVGLFVTTFNLVSIAHLNEYLKNRKRK